MDLYFYMYIKNYISILFKTAKYSALDLIL